jgi:homoserine O-acetyltransferase
MKELSDALSDIGNKNHNYVDVQSDYGHDAFLVEIDNFKDYIADVLK